MGEWSEINKNMNAEGFHKVTSKMHWWPGRTQGIVDKNISDTLSTICPWKEKHPRFHFFLRHYKCDIHDVLPFYLNHFGDWYTSKFSSSFIYGLRKCCCKVLDSISFKTRSLTVFSFSLMISPKPSLPLEINLTQSPALKWAWKASNIGGIISQRQ